MTTLRRFCCDDLFTFNAINLDPLTETVRCAMRNRVNPVGQEAIVIASPVLAILT